MHPSFLNTLCCPKTGSPLQLEAEQTDQYGRVITGALRSPEGEVYPILRGVPRFVERERYAATFGYEWNRWPRVQFESENTGGPMEGHTTRMWEICTGRGLDRLYGQTVVEFGCGTGRFIDIVRFRGGRAVGLDPTLAVEAAAQTFADDPDVLIVQADPLAPPFRSNAFDGGYTIGGFHHTPDPAAAVRQLAHTVRPEGWVACTIYPRDGFYDCPAVARFRRLQNLFRPILKYRFATAYSRFAANVLAPSFSKLRRLRRFRPWVEWLQHKWLLVSSLPDPRWRMLEVFNVMTIPVAIHTGAEVRDWMQLAGVGGLVETRWGETSLVGTRAPAPTPKPAKPAVSRTVQPSQARPACVGFGA